MRRRVLPVRVHAPAQAQQRVQRFAEAPSAAPPFWTMVAVGVTVSVISTVIISRFNLR